MVAADEGAGREGRREGEVNRTFIVHDVAQRSPEWLELRAGRMTSSAAADMLAMLKRGGGEAAGRRNLRVRLALERLMGRPMESGFQSDAMRQGVEREPLALAAYEAESGRLVQTVGFLSHDELPIGGSPDGVVGDYEGLIEIKCCQPPAHLEFLQATEPPDGYKKQCLHLLYLTGAQWVDLTYWSPDFPRSLQLKVMRIARNEQEIASYEWALKLFLAEVEQEELNIRELAQQRAASEVA